MMESTRPSTWVSLKELYTGDLHDMIQTLGEKRESLSNLNVMIEPWCLKMIATDRRG